MFPGQGSQFPGMAKELYETDPKARGLFDRANEIRGFNITEIMFNGTAEELKQTEVTQPAIFLHSVILAMCSPDFKPDMVAGHSLGEFSALTAAGALDFEDGLRLVSIRAHAMQKACEANPGTMAAILALPADKVEAICDEVEGVVVPANYNCEGQIVISGSVEAVTEASEKMKAAGAKRALILPVVELSIPLLCSLQLTNLLLVSKASSSASPSARSIRTSLRVRRPILRKSRRIFLLS